MRILGTENSTSFTPLALFKGPGLLVPTDFCSSRPSRSLGLCSFRPTTVPPCRPGSSPVEIGKKKKKKSNRRKEMDSSHWQTNTAHCADCGLRFGSQSTQFQACICITSSSIKSPTPSIRLSLPSPTFPSAKLSHPRDLSLGQTTIKPSMKPMVENICFATPQNQPPQLTSGIQTGASTSISAAASAVDVNRRIELMVPESREHRDHINNGLDVRCPPTNKIPKSCFPTSYYRAGWTLHPQPPAPPNSPTRETPNMHPLVPSGRRSRPQCTAQTTSANHGPSQCYPLAASQSSNMTTGSTPIEPESALEITRKAKLERRRTRRAMKKQLNRVTEMFHKIVVAEPRSEGHKQTRTRDGRPRGIM